MPHSQSTHAHKEHAPFSLGFFFGVVVYTSFPLFMFIENVFPRFYEQQVSSISRLILTGIALHFVWAYVEFFFHRYAMHSPLVRFCVVFWKKHSRHHALTFIKGVMTKEQELALRKVRSEFPITKQRQNESSFFPWYSLAGFFGLITIPLLVLQWLLPSLPIVYGGYGAAIFSFVLYECLHAVQHIPLDKLAWVLDHRNMTIAWVSRTLYAFHAAHHANHLCNESISGFFGIPVADWSLGTLKVPRTIYRDGEIVSVSEFIEPEPVWLIRWLDARARQSLLIYRRELRGH